MPNLSLRTLAVAVPAVLFGLACAPEVDGGTLSNDASTAPRKEAGAADTPPTTCGAAPAAPLDPEKLPACCGGAGKAHCVPKAVVPASAASALDSCTGGYCVPDSLIRDPSAKPRACKSLNGAEGVCASVCIPQVAQYKDVLPSEGCEADERCAPCVSPIDGKRTGACDIATSAPTASCGAPTAPPSGEQDAGGGPMTCCAGSGQPRGTCVPASVVSSDEKAYLKADTCASTALCVPSEMVPPSSFKPGSCTFDAPFAGTISGVCLSSCLSFSGIEGVVLQRGTCDSVHLCVPCKDPLGRPTGAPGC